MSIEKLVYLYAPDKPPKIPKKEYKAIYELFGSVGKDPRDFYSQNNEGRIRIQDNKIIYLDARRIGLKILSKSIGNFKNLKVLNLYHNQIKNIPREIGNLENLEELYLYDNQIKTIPREIGNLENLKELGLYNNQLDKKSIEFFEKLKENGVRVDY